MPLMETERKAANVRCETVLRTQGTGRICESDLSAPKTLTDLENLFTATPHGLH
jgi:hypothetical protein